MNISDQQHTTANEIIDVVKTLVKLKESYPAAVTFTVNTLMPESSFGRDKIKPSEPAMRNKILAEVILADDLDKEEVKLEVAAKKK
jgi:hypothetical protein